MEGWEGKGRDRKGKREIGREREGWEGEGGIVEEGNGGGEKVGKGDEGLDLDICAGAQSS